jgi:2-keto-4-pentenoate hydratase
MTVNGEVVGEGHGSDVMGHPLEPVAWLANTLAKRGKSLSSGMIILTGSFAPPVFLKSGDSASVSIAGLGEAHLEVT